MRHSWSHVPDDPTTILAPDTPAAESLRRGRLLRKETPRRVHSAWAPVRGRDPVATVIASNRNRLPQLVPIRMGRMSASPFAFLRGSAAVMAGDLAKAPVMGATVQLCGDAHLANFGVYASPERRLVFDLNDFDETYVGPWEWDVKRLAASVVVASRENGYREATCRDLAQSVGRAYRSWIRRYASQRALEVWYAHIPIEAIIQRVEEARRQLPVQTWAERAQRRDHLAALGRLSTRAADGSWLIRDRPPLLVRVADDYPGRATLPDVYRSYLQSLTPERRVLVEKHRLVDVALKVVGVGSVGTRCYIALMRGPAGGPLVLQIKEARQSVLSPYVTGHHYSHQGERVVTGQRIMQAFGDIFLGWTRSPVSNVHYYVRQLHDMKYGVDIAGLRPVGMEIYAEVCAWALARAHARSGNPAEIAGYLGPGEVFDDALATFATAYADQTERDHAAFTAAIRSGKIAVETGV
jgi:uncharacterized protein (DUF2252 family)